MDRKEFREVERIVEKIIVIEYLLDLVKDRFSKEDLRRIESKLEFIKKKL
jgi:hypothetical protein